MSEADATNDAMGALHYSETHYSNRLQPMGGVVLACIETGLGFSYAHLTEAGYNTDVGRRSKPSNVLRDDLTIFRRTAVRAIGSEVIRSNGLNNVRAGYFVGPPEGLDPDMYEKYWDHVEHSFRVTSAHIRAGREALSSKIEPVIDPENPLHFTLIAGLVLRAGNRGERVRIAEAIACGYRNWDGRELTDGSRASSFKVDFEFFKDLAGPQVASLIEVPEPRHTRAGIVVRGMPRKAREILQDKFGVTDEVLQHINGAIEEKKRKDGAAKKEKDSPPIKQLTPKEWLDTLGEYPKRLVAPILGATDNAGLRQAVLSLYGSSLSPSIITKIQRMVSQHTLELEADEEAGCKGFNDVSALLVALPYLIKDETYNVVNARRIRRRSASMLTRIRDAGIVNLSEVPTLFEETKSKPVRQRREASFGESRLRNTESELVRRLLREQQLKGSRDPMIPSWVGTLPDEDPMDEVQEL